MPRQPRIEYPGAIYHVMARGNRRGPIVLTDSDRELFVETLAEACEKSAWEIYAWVLLDNHYHLALRTPTGNLVEGMKWFQNTARNFDFWRRIHGRAEQRMEGVRLARGQTRDRPFELWY